MAVAFATVHLSVNVAPQHGQVPPELQHRVGVLGQGPVTGTDGTLLYGALAVDNVLPRRQTTEATPSFARAA
jgi:hypothetical protein